jgi:hypothetical protein
MVLKHSQFCACLKGRTCASVVQSIYFVSGTGLRIKKMSHEMTVCWLYLVLKQCRFVG